MGMWIVCITLGVAAVGCAAMLVSSSLEVKALRARLGTITDAEQDAARIRRIARSQLVDAELAAARLENLARGMLLEAEDEATRITTESEYRVLALRAEIAELETQRNALHREAEDHDEITGVFRTPRQPILA